MNCLASRLMYSRETGRETAPGTGLGIDPGSAEELHPEPHPGIRLAGIHLGNGPGNGLGNGKGRDLVRHLQSSRGESQLLSSISAPAPTTLIPPATHICHQTQLSSSTPPGDVTEPTLT